MVFDTTRLSIQELSMNHLDDFYRLHADKDVMNLIPAPVFTYKESKKKLEIYCRIVSWTREPESP